jgi:chromosome segregation ATPase
MSDPNPSSGTAASGGTSASGAMTPVLIGAVLALVGASIYSFYQINQLKRELAETREMLAAEIGQTKETATTETRSSRASVDALKAELEQARQQAAQLAGQARLEANRLADELEEKLQAVEQEQAAKTAQVAASVSAVSSEVAAVKQDTSANRERVSAVSSEVAAVRSQAEATKAELQKTIAELTSTRGDLGIQSDLIATNARQLAALRERGERIYTEFRIAKAKTATKVGDLQIRLLSTDPKKNRYSVEVVADDKRIEKKDRTANEPVQFILGRNALPHELVVNEVKKDLIVGYLSAPKVQATRN